MSEWRAGKFDRSKGHFWRHFTPGQAAHSLAEINPEELVAAGKKLILVDVDNTLVEWRSEEIPQSTLTWLAAMLEAGLKICILSNTRNVERLGRLAGTLGVPYLVGRFKPSTAMYKKALQQFDAKPEEAVMIGDQIFTDVLGANRAGIDAIWVKQLAPVDFLGTKLSRMGEKIVRRKLYKRMDKLAKPLDSEDVELEGGPDDADDDLAAGGSAAFELLRNPVVRQFVKFCIVGFSSTLVDIGLSIFLTYHATVGGSLLGNELGNYLMRTFPSIFGFTHIPSEAAFPIFKIMSSMLAILNAFVWNRRWTFKIKGKEHRSVQLQKFFTVALVGMLLNFVVTVGLKSLIPGHLERGAMIASVIATFVVAFWNFFGQKYWTFKHRH